MLQGNGRYQHKRSHIQVLCKQAGFESVTIEDMPLPFFCMTSDLTDGQAKAQRSGPIWRALKASVSIPGLLPPVVIDGHWHVDGGIMNNLPVDMMAAQARSSSVP